MVLFLQLRDFLGVQADDPKVAQLLQAQHLPYRIEPVAERGTVAFAPAKGEAYTVEEAVVRSEAAASCQSLAQDVTHWYHPSCDAALSWNRVEIVSVCVCRPVCCTMPKTWDRPQRMARQWWMW